MEDFVGFIVWVAIAIGVSLFSALKKKKEQQDNAMPVPPKPKSDPFAELDVAERARKTRQTQPVQQPSKQSKQRQPEITIALDPAVARLPEEAPRVTITTPRASAPVKPKANPLGIDLTDREQLKRAIILGEILPPKF